MSISTYITKLLTWCAKWDNYSEKKNNDLNYLYTKDKNVGDANYNCFAYDVDTKYKGFFSGAKNGYAWCTSYVACGLCENFGKAMAMKMTGIPENSYAAVVPYWRNYMDKINRVYSHPAVGDMIFFGDQHIGIVAQVNTNGTFYTWEGNTTSGNQLANSGGQVHYKGPYTLKSSYEFGRPLWGLVDSSYEDPITTLQKGDKNDAVQSMQKNLTTLGYNTNGVDGSFGANTESAVKDFQKKHNLTVDGVAGPITINKINSLISGGKTAVNSTTSTSTNTTTTSSTTTKTNGYTMLTTQMPKLTKGMAKNVYVAIMQQALLYKGYVVTPDGDFGEKTLMAVKEYQSKNGLTKDGIWGQQCWNSLKN